MPPRGPRISTPPDSPRNGGRTTSADSPSSLHWPAPPEHALASARTTRNRQRIRPCSARWRPPARQARTSSERGRATRKRPPSGNLPPRRWCVYRQTRNERKADKIAAAIRLAQRLPTRACDGASARTLNKPRRDDLRRESGLCGSRPSPALRHRVASRRRSTRSFVGTSTRDGADRPHRGQISGEPVQQTLTSVTARSWRTRRRRRSPGR